MKIVEFWVVDRIFRVFLTSDSRHCASGAKKLQASRYFKKKSVTFNMDEVNARNVLDLPALCKRLRLSVQQPWNAEHISSHHRQEFNSLSQNFPNAKRNQKPVFAQPLDSTTRRLSNTRWSRGSRGVFHRHRLVIDFPMIYGYGMTVRLGLLDNEESKRKPIAVPPPAGNSFTVSLVKWRCDNSVDPGNLCTHILPYCLFK